MIEKLDKIQRRLKRLLPKCIVKYGLNFYNNNLVDFYIYFDKRKKYIKVTMDKAKIGKINIGILAKEIKTIINRQYYGIKAEVVVFDEFTGNECKE